MKPVRRTFLGAMVMATALVVSAVPDRAEALTPDEAKAIAEDAYIYGYSLISVEMSRKVITNVEAPATTRAPMGQFANLREYPTAAYRDVTAPNADTLYSNAFVDVSKEPWIVSWPDMGDRYYVWEFYDAWVPVVFDPGSRTTGQGAQTYAITGPGWSGTLPEGVTEVKVPTSLVWVLARTYSSGTPEDYKAVWALQDQYKLSPLSAWGQDYTPPPGQVDPNVDTTRSVRDSVNELDAEGFFQWMNDLMVDNPPAPEDAPMVARMAGIGIAPGADFDLSKFEPDVAAAIEAAPKSAWEKIAAYTAKSGVVKHGYLLNLKVGHYGTDYMARAWLSAFGIPANAPKDAVYPVGLSDADGQPFDASKHDYVIHFASRDDLPPVNATPPVHGFWSLTMYDSEYFFVPNALDRYTLSERNELKANADGSIDLYLQKDNPGPDREANWLPAPDGGFIPMFRLYWPQETPPSVLDGSWWPPAIAKAD